MKKTFGLQIPLLAVYLLQISQIARWTLCMICILFIPFGPIRMRIR